MAKHSFKASDKQRAKAAAKRLLGFLNLGDDFEHGTVTETVTAGDEVPHVISEHAITRQDIERLKTVLGTLNELQQRASKRGRVASEDYAPINAELARYKWITQIDGISSKQAHFASRSIDASATDEMGRKFSLAVVTVVEHGMLGRVRPCLQCKRWFLAPRRHSLFCSTPHQQKYWRALPQVKAKNRKYQRDYYRDKLSVVTRKPQSRRAS